MSVMQPDTANLKYFVIRDSGVLELHLYDCSDVDGSGAGLYHTLGNNYQESLELLKKMYNFVLESQKLKEENSNGK